MDSLRSLAEKNLPESGSAKLISIYLDVRPAPLSDQGGKTGAHILLNEKFQEWQTQLESDREAIDHLSLDISRISETLEDLPEGTSGVAIFASHAAGIWEVFYNGEAFRNEAHMNSVPRLEQILKFKQKQPHTLLSIVNSHSMRVVEFKEGFWIDTDYGWSTEVAPKKSSGTGWSQANYQRHIEEEHRANLKLMTDHFARVSAHAGIELVIIAGDEINAHNFMKLASEHHEMPPIAGECILSMHANLEEISECAAPLIRKWIASKEIETANTAWNESAAADMGAAGFDSVSKALKYGQVRELVIEEAHTLSVPQIDALLCGALGTNASVSFVARHPDIHRMDGVAAILRYHL